MKIIELLNKIANREEVPKEIKYDRFIYKWCEDIGDYRIDGYGECLLIKTIFGTFNCCGRHNSLYNMIYDKVEIIEEDKEIEKEDLFNLDESMTKASLVAWQKSNNRIFKKKIDELIDKVNSLENKQ